MCACRVQITYEMCAAPPHTHRERERERDAAYFFVSFFPSELILLSSHDKSSGFGKSDMLCIP